VHGRVVDSAVVAAEASGLFGGLGGGGGVEKKITRWAGLEKLCKELLGVRIRGKGGKAHDSLEDVLATREVVLWCLRNPEELRLWAVKHWQVKSRGGYGSQGRKGDSGRNKKGVQGNKGYSGQNAKGGTRPESSYMWYDSDDEMPRWEDVVDYECWPKSPPDWSD
jgi:DNA polymerase III epsilon subunit-like protein